VGSWIVARFLSPAFSTAATLAAELHAAQKRKKSDRDVAYVSHLFAVAALILEDGGGEDEAIAGLLHDSVEDQGMTGQRLGDEFGADVARIVIACSDAAGLVGDEKPPWRARKQHHLDALRDLPPGDPTDRILRVTAADKLHNCRDLVADLEALPQPDRTARLAEFNGGPDGTCWYYAQMSALLSDRLPASRLTAQLAEATARLHELAGIQIPIETHPADTLN
jgi:(p)ppGpp synthase/HD superfamily hydrolase